MVYWHIETDFVALAIFIVLIVKAVILNRQKNFTDKTFAIALVLGIASTIVDIFSSVMMNERMGWWLYEISMIIYGLFAPVLAVVWVLYTVSLVYQNEEKKGKQLITFFLAMYGVYAVVIVTNPIHELYFSLSETMEYARGALFIPLIVGSQLLYAVIGVILILVKRNYIPSKKIILLLLFLYFFTTASYFVQLAFPGWLIICSAFAVAYLVCDATFESDRRNRLYEQITQSMEQLNRDKERELEYQKRLEEAVQEAIRANEAKSSFLSRMSHDIRTPMNGIRGMLEIIRKERHNEERVDDCLDKIETASGYLLSLINDVLDMSKLESGEIKLASKPFDLRRVVEECNTVTNPLAVESGIQFTYRTVGELSHPYLVGSPLHLHQVIFNIVGNAIKYTRRGGQVTFTVEEISSDDARALIRFVVSDNGIGISEEFLPALFEPFSQEHDSSRSHYEGSGLGLAIVKKIIDRMEGEIAVESQEGIGSTFTFVIPFVVDHDPPMSADIEYTEAEISDLSGVRLLLVEDNELNMEIAQFMLEDAKAIVESAENGKAAVEKFSGSEPGYYAAILMDIMMPVMDGIEATRAIRALDRPDAERIPIIAMTANAFSEDAVKCIEAGMNAHLTKPLDSKTMLRALSTYVKQETASV